MKSLIILLASLVLSGCSSVSIAKKFSEFEALGVTKIEIVGKFSATEYEVTHENGVRKAELTHSNAWLTKVHVTRESKE